MLQRIKHLAATATQDATQVTDMDKLCSDLRRAVIGVAKYRAQSLSPSHPSVLKVKGLERGPKWVESFESAAKDAEKLWRSAISSLTKHTNKHSASLSCLGRSIL